MAPPAAAARLPRLGYWNTRALAEPIRLLLALADVQFDDKRYEVGPPPAYDKSCWESEKHSLGLAFPNLPYWIDDARGVRLTQSHAILLHIAETHGLAGTTSVERAASMQAVESVRDWLYSLFDVTYANAPWMADIDEGVHVEGAAQASKRSARFDAMRAKYEKGDLLRHLRTFEAALALRQPSPWISGGTDATVADCSLFECVDQHALLWPAILEGDEWPLLRAHHRAFAALPKIAAYRTSDRFKAEPVHNKYSHLHTGWVQRAAS